MIAKIFLRIIVPPHCIYHSFSRSCIRKPSGSHLVPVVPEIRSFRSRPFSGDPFSTLPITADGIPGFTSGASRHPCRFHCHQETFPDESLYGIQVKEFTDLDRLLSHRDLPLSSKETPARKLLIWPKGRPVCRPPKSLPILLHRRRSASPESALIFICLLPDPFDKPLRESG